VHQEERRLDIARALLEEALAIHREIGDVGLEGAALMHLGAIELEEARLEEALGAYLESVEVFRELGDVRREAVASSCAGAALADLDRLLPAREMFASADDLVARLAEPMLAAAVEVHRGRLDLAEARAAGGVSGTSRPAAERVEQLRARARERVERASRPSAHGRPPLIQTSDDVRFAVRALQVSLERAGAAKPRLLVGDGAQWFQVPGGTRISLATRGTARRMLDALTRARLGGGEDGLSIQALAQAGWPEERVLPAALTNRVHVALTELRKLGLGDLLVRRDGGYALDPQVSVARV
jgi:hypothetical protein